MKFERLTDDELNRGACVLYKSGVSPASSGDRKSCPIWRSRRKPRQFCRKSRPVSRPAELPVVNFPDNRRVYDAPASTRRPAATMAAGEIRPERKRIHRC